MKTKDEIEALKEGWAKDPIWDLEYTEGFEEHIPELKAFRKEQEARWEIEREEKVKLSFEYRAGEILDELDATDRRVGHEEGRYSGIDLEHLIVAIQQARAVVLLSEQVNRIASAMESLDDIESLNQSARIWGGR